LSKEKISLDETMFYFDKTKNQTGEMERVYVSPFIVKGSIVSV